MPVSRLLSIMPAAYHTAPFSATLDELKKRAGSSQTLERTFSSLTKSVSKPNALGHRLTHVPQLGAGATILASRSSGVMVLALRSSDVTVLALAAAMGICRLATRVAAPRKRTNSFIDF